MKDNEQKVQQSVSDTNQIPDTKEATQEHDSNTNNNKNEQIQSEKMRYKHADEIYE
ncbi:hypothetical protein [Salipaludibacillus neizhouensis]|uniref:hypothetical protein n=1 Tax=Salipaludibacillus neizhouensis TaxID=885475 RepID=UPI00160341B5|nr:hypothetical protein [Salipaludibacillus neizhouensis]